MKIYNVTYSFKEGKISLPNWSYLVNYLSSIRYSLFSDGQLQPPRKFVKYYTDDIIVCHDTKDEYFIITRKLKNIQYEKHLPSNMLLNCIAECYRILGPNNLMTADGTIQSMCEDNYRLPDHINGNDLC